MTLNYIKTNATRACPCGGVSETINLTIRITSHPELTVFHHYQVHYLQCHHVCLPSPLSVPITTSTYTVEAYTRDGTTSVFPSVTHLPSLSCLLQGRGGAAAGPRGILQCAGRRGIDAPPPGSLGGTHRGSEDPPTPGTLHL